MKRLLLTLFIIFSFGKVFAQPAKEKAVEVDLRKCFDKINYWGNFANQNEQVNWSDSLSNANKKFAARLKSYTAAYPFMLTLPLKSLASDVKILTSADQQFRIISWDTAMGGTAHNCGYMMMYKSGTGLKSILNLGEAEDFNLSFYDKLFSLSANGHTYYMGVESASLGGWQYEQSINMFTINNGVLDSKAKIIKTASGLHNSISYTYNGGSDENNPPNPDIEYNEATQTFTLPLVVAKGKVAKNRITYKFTGRYFERGMN